MGKFFMGILLGLFIASAHAAAVSPYRGQEAREIKALSAAEIEGYLNGSGMGLAKAAELNHYPGPRHVLDLAGELNLTPSQLQETRELFRRMQAEARDIGERVINKERYLDTLFADGTIDRKALQEILNDIGQLQATLRYVHLSAHLEQKKLLTKHQVMMYDKVRGYDEAAHDSHSHSH